MSAGNRNNNYKKVVAGIAFSAISVVGLAAGSHWHHAATAAGKSAVHSTLTSSARAVQSSLALPPLPYSISHVSKLALAPESAALSPRPAGVDASPANKLVVNYGKLPLSFEANQGQVSAPVQFLSRGHGYTLFLTGHEAVLALRKPGATGQKPDEPVKQIRLDKLGSFLGFFRQDQVTSKRDSAAPGSAQRLNSEATAPAILRLQLMGANSQAKVTGVQELPGKSNYFIGNDPVKWRTNVPTYANVKYAGVYPGVDLVYYGNQSGQLEYDFVVAPGADVNQIKLSFAGVDGTHIDEASGDLVLKAGEEEVRFHKPVVYQPTVAAAYDRHTFGPKVRSALGKSHPELRIPSRDTLSGVFVLTSSNEVAFRVAGYDPKRVLVIDPVLSYSTYLGGSNRDSGNGIAVDSSGSAYVTGITWSADFPVHDPLQGRSGGGSYDAFVSKLNAAGSALVYSTYLGGSSNDIGFGIAVDSSGSAYVTGFTASANFPTAHPLPENSVNGGAFVSKLNAAGSALVYSSVLGSGQDTGVGIAVDSSSNAYVAGYTYSTNFPTANPFQATCGTCAAGNPTAFVMKINAAGSALVYSTFLGGTSRDYALGIAVDSSDSAYVTGSTNSANFPTFKPIQATCGGCISGSINGYYDAFVAKFNSSGSALVYSTFLGGSYTDVGYAIAVDSSGNAYVTGQTTSTDFPTANPIQAACGYDCAAYGDAFVAKLNFAGSTLTLVYSTFLGGSYVDSGYGIAVDSSGNAFVAGSTLSTDFPTVNPLQGYGGPNYSGLIIYNAFVAKFNAAGSALVYSTYLGGSNGSDGAQAIALDSSGNAYVTGTAGSTDFPTVNPIQDTCGGCTLGYYDAFVAKISGSGSGGGGDFDGDGKADYAVWRPSSGDWFIIPSSNPSSAIIQQWGTQGDIPVRGDYDGDGKTDIAVFRPSTGIWFIIPSSNPSSPILRQWGTNGDIPVPGDYDGDGKTDISVWRPSTGIWFIIPSSNPSSPILRQWGTNGDIPVPVDYDRDRKTDIAVWRPSNGVWFVIPSSAPSTFTITQWGASTDVPVQKPIGQ